MSADARFDDNRASARQRLYTARWDVAALSFKRLHPLCLGCAAVGVVAATEVVDHVVPHKGNVVQFWNREFWQPCCRWHHDVVKQRLELLFAAGKLLAADLWLDSKAAVAFTRKHRSAIGDDGWVT